MSSYIIYNIVVFLKPWISLISQKRVLGFLISRYLHKILTHLKASPGALLNFSGLYKNALTVVCHLFLFVESFNGLQYLCNQRPSSLGKNEIQHPEFQLENWTLNNFIASFAYEWTESFHNQDRIIPSDSQVSNSLTTH